MRNIIASLDIGSNAIKLVVGEIYKNKLNVLSSCEVPSRGVKGGFVVNNESTLEALKEIFDKTNDLLGVSIDKVVLNVPSYNLSSFVTTSSMSINNIVTNKDVNKLIDLSVKDKVISSYELVAISPVFFVINDLEKVDDPVGMNAEKLALKAVGNIVPKKNITQIESLLKTIGVNVADNVANPISDYYEFANNYSSSVNGAIVNIGEIKTEVSIFNKGILSSSEVLNVGAITIDQAIAYTYKICKADAVKVKEKLVVLDKANALASESLVFNNKNGDLVKINQYDASLIAIEKFSEILNLIKKQINLLTKKEISYIIVSGGVTQARDFEFLLDEVFSRNAKIGFVKELGVRDNKFSSCSGLIKYYDKKMKKCNINFSSITGEALEEFSGIHKKVNISGTSPLGKVLGIFYDN